MACTRQPAGQPAKPALWLATSGHSQVQQAVLVLRYIPSDARTSTCWSTALPACDVDITSMVIKEDVKA